VKWLAEKAVCCPAEYQLLAKTESSQKNLNSCGYDPHIEGGSPDQVLTTIDHQPLGPLPIGIIVSRHRPVPGLADPETPLR